MMERKNKRPNDTYPKRIKHILKGSSSAVFNYYGLTNTMVRREEKRRQNEGGRRKTRSPFIYSSSGCFKMQIEQRNKTTDWRANY